MSLLALPVRERFGNDVVLILSHNLQNVHEVLLSVVSLFLGHYMEHFLL